jgi:hypothetical protein
MKSVNFENVDKTSENEGMNTVTSNTGSSYQEPSSPAFIKSKS